VKINGRPQDVQPGDIVLCTDPGSIFSAGIRWLTGSQASHAALVTAGDPAWGDFWVLEVGWRIRPQRISEFSAREWCAWRPTWGLQPLPALAGAQIARDTLAWLAADGVLGALYPWWKLPAYWFARDWRGRLLRAGARQVCSVTTIRAAITHGVEVWSWRGDNRDVLLTADEVESVTPADLARNAVEQGWEEIAWTDNAPII
jgi:hypothetical protein